MGFSIPGYEMCWILTYCLQSPPKLPYKSDRQTNLCSLWLTVESEVTFNFCPAPETSLLFCHLDQVSVQPIQGGLTRGKYSIQPENETMKMLNGGNNTEWQGIRGMSLESESKSKFSIPQSPYWAFLWHVCVCPFSCAPSDSVRQIRTLSVLISSRMGWRWWWSGMYFVNQPP